MNNQRVKKYRSAPIREAICDSLKQVNEPVDYNQIERYFVQNNIKANKTTIYRQLDSLLEVGYISELDFGEGKKRYELKKKHHHHLLCTNCKKVECIDLDSEVCEKLHKLENSFLRKNKFKIKSHMLEFFGLCGLCQEQICNKH